MKKLFIHLGLLLLMFILIIVNILNKNMTGLAFGVIAALFWIGLSIEDIIELKRK
jgi:hypothetical protein